MRATQSGGAVAQRVLYENVNRIKVRLPFTSSLQRLHGTNQACFPLLRDPLEQKRTSMLGMFVLRPGSVGWNTSLEAPRDIGPAADGLPSWLSQVYEVEDWVYNASATDGGVYISNHNTVDAYRLALQYATVDAVLVSGKTVCSEGLADSTTESDGYLYQYYSCCAWDALKGLGDLEQLLAAQRVKWQQMGYLSKRRYPATIIVSRSGAGGEVQEDGRLAPDFLDAPCFDASRFHPDGTSLEAYVLTSEHGKQRILQRLHKRSDKDQQWKSKVTDALLSLSPSHDPTQIDLNRVCEMLYRQLDIRMAQHDGGGVLMSEFIVSGAISQLNFSLMRKQSQQQLMQTQCDFSYLFRNNEHAMLAEARGRLPGLLKLVYLLADTPDQDNVALATFAIDLP